MINRKIIDDYNDVGVLILTHGSPILPILPCKPIVRLRIRSRWSSNNYNNTGTAGPRHHDTTNDMPKSLILGVATISQRTARWHCLAGRQANFQNPLRGGPVRNKLYAKHPSLWPSPMFPNAFCALALLRGAFCMIPNPLRGGPVRYNKPRVDPNFCSYRTSAAKDPGGVMRPALSAELSFRNFQSCAPELAPKRCFLKSCSQKIAS